MFEGVGGVSRVRLDGYIVTQLAPPPFPSLPPLLHTRTKTLSGQTAAHASNVNASGNWPPPKLPQSPNLPSEQGDEEKENNSIGISTFPHSPTQLAPPPAPDLSNVKTRQLTSWSWRTSGTRLSLRRLSQLTLLFDTESTISSLAHPRPTLPPGLQNPPPLEAPPWPPHLHLHLPLSSSHTPSLAAMAVLLAYIEPDPTPPSKPPAITYLAPADPIILPSPKPHPVPPPPRKPHDTLPAAAHRPVRIPRPSGLKITPQAAEDGLDPTTAFNTQFNARRPALISYPEIKTKTGGKRVRFKERDEVIPPVCMELVLYRAYGPGDFKVQCSADAQGWWWRRVGQGFSMGFWGAFCI